MLCPARGQTGKGNIHVHSQKDKRYICDVCRETFTTSKGTIFYRLRHDPKIVLCVIILLAYGCPLQAIVMAFDLDERTVRNWHERAGKHCQQVHEKMVALFGSPAHTNLGWRSPPKPESVAATHNPKIHAPDNTI